MKIRKILIGIDDSEFSQYATEFGFDIAQTYKAAVGLVHIIEPIVTPIDSSEGLVAMPFEANIVEPVANLESLQTDRSEVILDRAAKELGAGLEITKFTQYGTTAEGIIECAIEFNADLIVIGTHRRTGLDRLFLGNVAESVVQNSDISVMVVPFKGDEA